MTQPGIMGVVVFTTITDENQLDTTQVQILFKDDLIY